MSAWALLLFALLGDSPIHTAYHDEARVLVYPGENLAVGLAVAYSRSGMLEESLALLARIPPQHVADPATYWFYKAYNEHALGHGPAAKQALAGLETVGDVPVRYQVLVRLMEGDMQSWKPKDAGAVARKMASVARRLSVAKGGPETQLQQAEIKRDLDELIKRMEADAKKAAQAAAGQGGQKQQQARGAGKPEGPQQDSHGGKESGKGELDQRKLEQLAKQWGSLPEKERAEAMQQLSRDMGSKYRDVVNDYFRELARKARQQEENHK